MEKASAKTNPFASSFLDRFMKFVERQPIPYWLTYLILFILQGTLAHLLAWIDGWLPAFTFSPIAFLFPLWQWIPFAIMTYLNRASLRALSSFSSLMHVDEGTLAKLRVEFTTMPSRGVILSGVVWSVIYIFLTYLAFNAIYVAFGLGKFFSVFLIVEGLIAYATGSAIYYHSLRQLRLVNSTMRMVRQFSLFQLNPVYAFSLVTSQTAVAWMLLLSLTLLLFPLKLADVPILMILALQVALAIAAFIFPLWFVHRRLVFQKRTLLAEHNLRAGSMLDQLHRCLDENKLDQAGQLNSSLNALNIERSILTGIPTWPWRTGTLTAFLSAIVLPIILFLVQIAIKGWLGK
jgi:hypothetical protein